MDGTVVQSGTNSNPVTLNVACGRVITVASVAASGTGFQFVVNNTAVDDDSVVLGEICYYTGSYITNGFPTLAIHVGGKGSFVVGVYNGGSTPFNGSFIIGFQCL